MAENAAYLPRAERLAERVDPHREGHERRGSTYAVFFPPEAPWDLVMQVTDRIAELTYGLDREGWDPEMFGHGGDCDLVPRSTPSGDARTMLDAAQRCAGHKHSPALGKTRCPLCDRFVPDDEVAAKDRPVSPESLPTPDPAETP